MPLQHISDNMLKSMRRGITKQKTIDTVNQIRDKVQGIAIRTTLIAGYPGETEQDHQEMLAWVQDSKFERLGIFTYSHEENTHAFSLKDTVSEKLKRKRADAVMAVQQEISYNLNQQKIGKDFKVLFDSEVLVKATNTDYISIGSFATIKITSATDFDLYGELIP